MSEFLVTIRVDVIDEDEQDGDIAADVKNVFESILAEGDFIDSYFHDYKLSPAEVRIENVTKVTA